MRKYFFTDPNIELWLLPHEVGIANEVIFADCYSLRVLAKHDVRYVLDIGGHVGAFAAFAAGLWPDARIVSVEPHPDNAVAFRRNCRELANVELVEAAISDCECDGLLSETPTNSGGHRLAGVWRDLDKQRASMAIKVPVLSVLDVIQRCELPRLDLLKLDCEGCEYTVLEQLRDSGFLRNVCWIRGEWHHESANDRILNALTDTHAVSISRGDGVGCFIAHRKA